MQKTKILIFVSGGIVQYVNANTDDVGIVIVDVDNQSEDEVSINGVLQPDAVMENLYDSFSPDSEDHIEVEIHNQLKELKF